MFWREGVPVKNQACWQKSGFELSSQYLVQISVLSPCAFALCCILHNYVMTLVLKVLCCFSALCPRCLLQLHGASLILGCCCLTRSFIPCSFSFWNVFAGLCVSLFFQLIFHENYLFLERFLVRSLATGAVEDDINLVSVTFMYSLNQSKWTNRNLLTVDNEQKNILSLHCSRCWVYWWRIITSIISVH